MAQLYFPRDSLTDKFVAKIPVDEGLAGVDDFDIVLDSECKTLVVIAKRKPQIQVDAVPCSSPIAASPLDGEAKADGVLESQLS